MMLIHNRAQKKNEVVKEDKPKEEVKASVSDLKSVFEKKNTTVVPGKGKFHLNN